MIFINVTYDCKPGKREAFYREICERGIGEKSRSENGCGRYEYFNAIEKPDRLFLAEEWSDPEALAAHSASAHFAELQGLKAEYVEDVTIKKIEKE